MASVQRGAGCGAEGLGEGVCAPCLCLTLGWSRSAQLFEKPGGGGGCWDCTGAVGRPLPCLIASQNEVFKDTAFAVEVEGRLTNTC